MAEKNVLNEKIAKREEMINRILEKNEVEEVLMGADQGDPQSMVVKFNFVHPEDGGFSDLNKPGNEDLMAEVNEIIEEKLEEAKEKGEFVNNWDLYRSAGEQVRRDNIEFDSEGEYGLYRNPGKTLQDRIDDDRTEVIEQMRQSREPGEV